MDANTVGLVVDAGLAVKFNAALGTGLGVYPSGAELSKGGLCFWNGRRKLLIGFSFWACLEHKFIVVPKLGLPPLHRSVEDVGPHPEDEVDYPVKLEWVEGLGGVKATPGLFRDYMALVDADVDAAATYAKGPICFFSTANFSDPGELKGCLVRAKSVRRELLAC